MDKLRILWIDDCGGCEEDFCYPESRLPEQYQPYFQIVQNPSEFPSSAATTSEFLDIFVPFFLGGKTDDLPAEIVVMDYDLSKYRPPCDTSIDLGDQDTRPDIDISSISSAVPTAAITEGQAFRFEGLIFGTFYAAMTSLHPAGVVPITSHSILANNSVVRMMHELYQRILKVNFSNFIAIDVARSWANVLPLGVQAFRQRVEALHIDGDLQLYFDDLMKIYDGSGDILTIRSKHATRRLPIRGIFIDHDDGSWRAAAKKWASALLADIVGEGHIATLRRADTIAEELWEGYNNNELFEKRWRLSGLHSRREELNGVEKDELAELYRFFGVQLGSNPDLGTCSENTVDLRNYDLDDATRRWASLFVLFRLLQRMVKARKKWQEATARRTNPLNLQNVPVEDWMLALYPIAKDPIILPFPEFNTKDSAKDIGKAWGKNLYRNRGEYAINPLHVFSGYDWGKELKKGPACGLRQSERRILLERTLDSAELTEKDWAQCEQAQIIFHGEAKDE